MTEPIAQRRKKRPKYLNPAYEQSKVYLPRELKADVQKALRMSEHDLSSLMRVLLGIWLEGKGG